MCVLGSGFAGSLTALVLRKAGMSVALIDRATHPRFAIGESSTPAADYLLHQLAQQYKLDELLPCCQFGTWRERYPRVRCGCKRGFSYVWHGSGEDYRASPAHDCELMVTASASAHVADTQWYRPDVDQFLFQLAVSHGVWALELADLTSVQRIVVNGRHRWQATFQTDSSNQSIAADFIVDASGPSSRFMRLHAAVDLTSSLSTHTSAVYTHVENGPSTLDWLTTQGAVTSDFPFPFDQAAVHHLFHDGWLWQIGFECNLTSIGFVTSHRSEAARCKPPCESSERQLDAHQRWMETLDFHPVLRSILAGSSLATLPGKMLGSGRIQRLTCPNSAPDWAALPFTVGFIDPLHSTGIAHALSGIKRICEALLTSNQSQKNMLLSNYARDLQEEFWHLDRMISGCYDGLCDFRLFNCWTMIYFAAATTFERQHRAGGSPSFLLSQDAAFRQVLAHARRSLDELLRSPVIKAEFVDAYQREIRDLIAPFNSVGLFAPRQTNMYWHTAAEK